MAECAGLSEMTTSETDRIKEIVDRLVHKPNTEYLLTTHLTEHHIELTDYTPIRHHSPGKLAFFITMIVNGNVSVDSYSFR